MIFVTVGAQMPFDRLVRAVDEWAAERRRPDVFAQIGRRAWQPRCIAWAEFLRPEEFRDRAGKADLIVAHAGMGSILTALELGKPILVMPRRGDLGETRNDHQVATARRIAALGSVGVAFDESELRARLDALDGLSPPESIGHYASDALLARLREFLTE